MLNVPFVLLKFFCQLQNVYGCIHGLFNGDFISDIYGRLSREIGDLLICKLENVLLMQSVHLHIDSVDRKQKGPREMPREEISLER